MCPLCQFVRTIWDVCGWIKCPLITFFFNDILTYWHCSWECTDFFEIWNICSNSNFKCLIINCFCSKFRSIFLSCNDFICIYNAVKHVAVVSCCSWVNKTFPSVFKISCCNIFSVWPFDTVTKVECISNCSVFILNFIIALCLTISKFCVIYCSVRSISLFSSILPFH